MALEPTRFETRTPLRTTLSSSDSAERLVDNRLVLVLGQFRTFLKSLFERWFSLVVVGTLAGFGLLYLWLGLRDLSITLDGFGFIARAASLPADFAWVDGFYPLGYPLLLRLGFQIFGDYRVAGNILATIAAVGALGVYYLVARLINIPRVGSFLLLLMLAIATAFVPQATHLGTDMPQLLFLLLALWSLLRDERRWNYFFGGMFLGLGYLMRYTALVFLLATLMLIGIRRKWRLGAVILAGFVLASIPQLLPSFISTGNPLYNSQVVHVARGLGELDGLDEWVADRRYSNVTLIRLITTYPLRLVEHTLMDLRWVFFDLSKWTGQYLYLLVLPAIVWVFLGLKGQPKLHLLALWWVVYAFAISIALVHPRVLLPILPLTYLFVMLMLLNWNALRSWSMVFLLGLVILEFRWFAISEPVLPQRRSPEVYQAASRTLNLLNAFEPKVQATVLNPSCAGSAFYNLGDPRKTPVDVTVVSERDRQNSSAFRTVINQAGYRYVILEKCDLASGFDWLKSDLPDGFRWASIQETFSVLEVEEN